MKFSQRMGITPSKSEIQINSMNDGLRNSLWNLLKTSILDRISHRRIRSSNLNRFFRILWMNYFEERLDTLDDHFEITYRNLYNQFFEWEWYDVYNFIQFILEKDLCLSPLSNKLFIAKCNIILEKQLSGYRIIDKLIAPIIDKNEKKEIEEVLKESEPTKLLGVHTHVKEALSKLSEKVNPDYRNSIKESISAVESISKIISGTKSGGLAPALNIIESKIGLHKSLKKGFSALYGYTSDENGIRHAILDSSKCEFEDAKYMLVSCSAFINYLIVRANKAGITF